MNLNEFITLRRNIIEKYFSRMNTAQLKATLITEGSLLVLAGAGSGKTTVLVNRIANILKFGKAYYSDECFSLPDAEQEKLMRDYLGGSIGYPDELDSLLSVDPPKPWEILAITFTNKAAGELKDRLCALLGPSSQDIWASTFHSSCAKILRRSGEELGYSSHFTIYDTDDTKRVIKDSMSRLDIDDKFLPVKSVLSSISRAKDMLVSPADYIATAGNDIVARKTAEVYADYSKQLLAADAMDFDDLIVNAVRLLEKDCDAARYYTNKFKYVLVDEYQDTNHAQFRLTQLLSKGHGNIFVVGDDDQSIYRFRGATIENILGFEKRYPSAVVIRLEQNYRSTQTILDAANAVIANNSQRKGKTLWTDNGSGDKITVSTSDDAISEARYIANTISLNKGAGFRWSDHAILYRANAQSNQIENALIRAGVPYRIIGGHRFYERKEIRDAMAYLAVLSNPSDEVRLRRIINEPKRGIGEATLTRASEMAHTMGVSMYEVISHAEDFPSLARAAKKLMDFTSMMDSIRSGLGNTPLDEILGNVMLQTGYPESLRATEPDSYTDRIANLQELKENLRNYSESNDEPTLNGFLEEVALMTDIDNYNADSDSVVLMTLHSAKGLEFPVVFIAGMENGVFPSLQSIGSQDDMQEERRIAYVGITRAKKRLYLTLARQRQLYGSTTYNPRSVFLGEIPPELCEEKNESSYHQQHSVHSGFSGTGGSKDAQRRTSGFTSYEKEKKPPMNRGFSGKTVSSVKNAGHKSYSPGDSVEHTAFGKGMVISVRAMGNDALVEVAFDSIGTKKIMANNSPMNKI